MELESKSIILARKDEHLDICREEDVSASQGPGWDSVVLPHCALPDLDFDEIDLSTNFLGEKYSAPILISSMTGGSADGEFINARLAEFAQQKNIPMGVGSQRIAFEDSKADLFNFKKVAPKAKLFANLGAVQFNYGITVENCLSLIDGMEPRAFILHLNPLQEAIQKEGDRNFKGLWLKVAELCKRSPIPIIVKETGCGLDTETCRKAVEAGVSALDIAGMGGTHWGFIEGLRNSDREFLGSTFRNWGITSVESLRNVRAAVPKDFPIIASGGIRTGLDITRAFYLKANFTGLALPFLKAVRSDAALEKLYFELTEACRVALFCTNSGNFAALGDRL